MAGETKKPRRCRAEKQRDNFLDAVSHVSRLIENVFDEDIMKIPDHLDDQHRESAINDLKEAEQGLVSLRQRIDRGAVGKDDVGKEPWRNAILRACRGDMSALADRIDDGEATDVERWIVARILLNPDAGPKHSIKNMAEADRDREIAESVDFIASHEGEKKTTVVEEWTTKEYGLKRSTIWERMKRGRLLSPKLKASDEVNYLGRMEPDGSGGLKHIPPSPAKTQK